MTSVVPKVMPGKHYMYHEALDALYAAHKHSGGQDFDPLWVGTDWESLQFNLQVMADDSARWYNWDATL